MPRLLRSSFGTVSPAPGWPPVKGFVPTPPEIVDLMVGKLFHERPPRSGAALLDPGCGNGEFIEGVLRACQTNGWPVPRIVGVEQSPSRAQAARRKFADRRTVEIREADFLQPAHEQFDYIIGNPPYVAITGLDRDERNRYREAYETAIGRFDLYALFFEQALRLLRPDGRLVFISPEKFLYVETARPLRELLLRHGVEELHFVAEATFGDKVTYPLITTVGAAVETESTRLIRRDGSVGSIDLSTANSWQPVVEGFPVTQQASSHRLADVAIRISCGVATGADGVFVLPTAEVPRELERFAHPTISGRQILPSREVVLQSSLLAPYDPEGRLLGEHRLGALGGFLNEPGRRQQLEGRTCVGTKPWYAYHDNLPLGDMLRPKLLCKDITEAPFFVLDREGSLVPRHSIYYVVPADPADLDALAEYLNSAGATLWLRAHCQRAANGFLRMQSHVLKQLPLPAGLAASSARLRAATRDEALLLV